jgi:stage II sporulation protein D
LPALASVLLVSARVGCGRADRAEPVAPAPAMRGPDVLVEIADAPQVAWVAGGPVEIIRTDDGSRLFEGRLLPDGDRGIATFESGNLKLGPVRDPGPLEIRSLPRASGEDGAPLALEGPHGLRGFRGSFVVSGRDGRVRFANRLSLEEYLASVVGSEMAASAVPIEALKAQAVAARTYALFAILASDSRGKEARFASDVTFQAYGGIAKEHSRALQAVRATSGEVLTYRGGLFRAYFHSTCGGQTSDAARVFGEPSIEPLAGVECGACAGVRFARWEARSSSAEIEQALRPYAAQKGIALGALTNVEVSEADPDGRPRYVRIEHSGGAFEMLATKLRTALSKTSDSTMRSALFTVARQGGDFRFDGRGWGHGVGLCQAGAAKKGETETYREILRDYFPGSEIQPAY